MSDTVRVVLPAHLRAMAKVQGEVTVDVEGEVTQRSVLDALEAEFPMLLGTIRDRATAKRRAFVRFYACEEDLSHEEHGRRLTQVPLVVARCPPNDHGSVITCAEPRRICHGRAPDAAVGLVSRGRSR